MPMRPARVNITARPRSGPVPHQLPIQSAPRPSVISGMKISAASGPMMIEVMGDAAFSTIWAKPNTRPCFSNGIDRCSTVCSAASMTGIISSQTKQPTVRSGIEDCTVNTEQMIQFTRLQPTISFTGVLPRPNFATAMPPAMNAVMMKPQRMPQVWTETSSRP